MPDLNLYVSYAIVFHQQIRKISNARRGKDWKWQATIPGPISIEAAELVEGIAGCWCQDHSGKEVVFCTNDTHPLWKKDAVLERSQLWMQ